MSEEPTADRSRGLDVRALARELNAEDLDLEDIFEDRAPATVDPSDTRASQGEPAHRATAVQVQRPRSDPPAVPEPDKVVLRSPRFGPMRLSPTKAEARPAATLPTATPNEATTASLASPPHPPRRRPLAWLILLLLVGFGAAAVAHRALSRPSPESHTP